MFIRTTYTGAVIEAWNEAGNCKSWQSIVSDMIELMLIPVCISSLARAGALKTKRCPGKTTRSKYQ